MKNIKLPFLYVNTTGNSNFRKYGFFFFFPASSQEKYLPVSLVVKWIMKLAHYASTRENVWYKNLKKKNQIFKSNIAVTMTYLEML